MSKLTDQEVMTILHEKGFKATPQRLAICKLVLRNKNHPSAEEIIQAVVQEHPSISRATVYKTLSLLREIGLVRELNFGEGYTRFDPNTSVHANIVCLECGKIFDYESATVTDLWRKLADEIGGETTGHRIDIYKICDDCSKD